jgi:hypothetical protein
MVMKNTEQMKTIDQTREVYLTGMLGVNPASTLGHKRLTLHHTSE